jgi:hypothetical protein
LNTPVSLGLWRVKFGTIVGLHTTLFLNNLFKCWNLLSSVSIVSGYGLDDRATEVRFPAEANGFFL